jgi:methyltransferase (TIGR00027 family)
VNAVAQTACLAAAARAREDERPDRLFSDPFAAPLAGATGFAYLDRLANVPTPYVAIRTRFFDDLLCQTVRSGDVRQVVLVAAGMDARAFRLPWPPGLALYELDQPEVLALKHAILAADGARATCRRHALGVDLTQSWAEALCAAGYRPREPSVWLMEGLLYYLEEAVVHALLDRMGTLTAPGSWLGIDLVSRDALWSPLLQPWLAMGAYNGAVWRFGTDHPEHLCTDHGWEPQVRQPGEEGADFGRWPLPVVPRGIPGMPRGFLVVARRCGGLRSAVAQDLHTWRQGDAAWSTALKKESRHV